MVTVFCTLQAILAGKHGSRPVTLVGYSFGSRVIFSCLKEICRRVDNIDIVEEEEGQNPSNYLEPDKKDANAEHSATTQQGWRHYIHDVIFLGAPINSNSKLWSHIRNVVSGRIINGYSEKDLVLGIIYR